MARNVGEYAKKMKYADQGPGKEMPKGAGKGSMFRPKHVVELMQKGCTTTDDGKYHEHEAKEGEDPKYHEAVKAFQTCYEGTKAEDSEDEGEQ